MTARSVGAGRAQVSADSTVGFDRRSLLKAGVRAGLLGGALIALEGAWPPRASAASRYGPLVQQSGSDLLLPNGFTSRIVARSSSLVANSVYKWHRAPDGGRVFPAASGGWTYVSNCELGAPKGGAASIQFRSDGEILGARRILDQTDRNCSGGHTPWGTWLSCEEFTQGRVWEVDPLGTPTSARVHSAMGRFAHEGAAVDGANSTVYMTEDAVTGVLYRYLYAGTDLSRGTLQAATVVGNGNEGSVQWSTVSDPSGTSKPTRRQVKGAKVFNGGEGIWFHDGVVNFATKGDDTIWAFDVNAQYLSVVYRYDPTVNPPAPLRGVDNLAVRANGDIFVCEDQGPIGRPEDPEICVIQPGGDVSVFLRALGHRASELTGVAFTPNGSRLYFSSQRGSNGTGVTYEVTGPF